MDRTRVLLYQLRLLFSMHWHFNHQTRPDGSLIPKLLSISCGPPRSCSLTWNGLSPSSPPAACADPRCSSRVAAPLDSFSSSPPAVLAALLVFFSTSNSTVSYHATTQVPPLTNSQISLTVKTQEEGPPAMTSSGGCRGAGCCDFPNRAGGRHCPEQRAFSK